jgi:hypothetical protein
MEQGRGVRGQGHELGQGEQGLENDPLDPEIAVQEDIIVVEVIEETPAEGFLLFLLVF